MKNRKLKYNAISALIFQAMTLVSGVILPALVLEHYGSDTNGLVNSIAQFLNIISFFELGVGAVVQSALYKPLVNHDNRGINEIISSANNFFSKLANGLLIYIVVLAIVYPRIIRNVYSNEYTVFLIGAMSISLFAEYYFGMTDLLLLSADQKAYVQYAVRTITVILNIIVSAIAINCNLSIQFVKLLSSLIYLLRPIALRMYVKRHYNIDRRVKYIGEPIPQKWNGVAQHIATIILINTDSIVLTFFSTLSNVSIYSIYYMIVNGIAQVINLATNGFTPLLGALWAKGDKENLNKSFYKLEWISHKVITVLFGITGILLIPFVTVYTRNINDANYNQPLFSVLITLALAAYSLRRPYNMLILAAGKFKETQLSYIVAAVLNILISVVTVIHYGLIGVALGTLISMLYHLVYMIIYDHKKLLTDSFQFTLYLFVSDAILILIGVLGTRHLTLETISYVGWIVFAIKVSVVWIIAFILTEVVMRMENILNVFRSTFRGEKNG